MADVFAFVLKVEAAKKSTGSRIQIQSTNEAVDDQGLTTSGQKENKS